MNAYDPNYGRELIGIQTPGASATILGVGGRPDYPTLRTAGGGAPLLGTTVNLQGQGPTGAAAVVLAGVAGLPSPTPWLPGFLEGGGDWVVGGHCGDRGDGAYAEILRANSVAQLCRSLRPGLQLSDGLGAGDVSDPAGIECRAASAGCRGAALGPIALLGMSGSDAPVRPT